MILMQFIWAFGKGLPAASIVGAPGGEVGQFTELPAQPLNIISSAHAANPVRNARGYFIVANSFPWTRAAEPARASTWLWHAGFYANHSTLAAFTITPMLLVS
ncbi:MAG TPA: hypothetical protein VFE56_04895, partial [Candidatus Binataceae bacterium]|nr:hypothetical protein [Candidatus Binataceae bacterium]